MDNNSNIIDDKEFTEELTKVYEIEGEQKSTGYIPILSMEYVLSRIDAIINDTEYIHEAIKAIIEIPIMMPTDGMMNYQGDYAGQAKAEAISQAISSREKTNQKLIQLLEKMYDDLKPQEPSEDILKIKQLTEALSSLPSEYVMTILQKSVQQMFVKPATAVVL